MKLRIFISSVQKEFADERRIIGDYLAGDPLLSRFFEVFLFEKLPAADQRPDQVYLDEVAQCDIYLGLFGDDYGGEDKNGLSPTHREFNEATRLNKERLIFIKGVKDDSKSPKMRSLISTAGSQLIRRRFTSTDKLTSAVYASLVQRLDRTGVIQSLPFDERLCSDAKIDDIDSKAIQRFIGLANRKRQFSLPETTSVRDILAHLNLLQNEQPTQAAALLFAKNPQRFVASSEIRCMHFHGTVIQRPSPYYQIFKGNLFEQVDQAVDFVLSKLDLSVGTRRESTQAPTRYEIPPDVISEAIVNAVAHRDYMQPGGIQVSVFADRLEIWNPGNLLTPLTLDQLRRPHHSLARNARICEGLYLAGYIEKYGTGTLMMIQESIKHALPEPDFFQEPGEFIVTIWRDWLTGRVLAELQLNDRQHAAIPHLKISRRITNAEYRKLTGAIAKTATRDLDDLVAMGVLEVLGKGGRGAAYGLVIKQDINRTNETFGEQDINRTNETSPARVEAGKGSGKAQSAHKGTKLALSGHQAEILRKCLIPSGIKALMEVAKRSDRTKFRNQVLNPLLNNDLLKMTIPDKPTSSRQKYRLTEKGRVMLDTFEIEGDEK